MRELAGNVQLKRYRRCELRNCMPLANEFVAAGDFEAVCAHGSMGLVVAVAAVARWWVDELECAESG